MPRTRNRVTLWSFFLMLWPDISQLDRITSNVVRCMIVTQSIRVGHVAILNTLFVHHEMVVVVNLGSC